jgi:streptogramin lyase
MLTVGALLAAAAAPAGAFVIQDVGGPQSATNGIALGPDGSFWVAEEFAGSVVRIAPSGAVLGRYAVGDQPHAVATGPGDRVWVAVNGAAKLVWFDAKAATPTTHTVTLPAGCAPDGLAAANGRMYFGCGSGRRVGYVADDGTGAVTTAAAGGGTVFDLEASGGKLYAPDYDGAVVRRLSKDLAVESTITLDNAGAGPDGIAADGAGNLWVTENIVGRLARFPAAQSGGTATEITPAGGAFSGPVGIVAGADGRIYVAARGSHDVVRLDATGANARFYGVADNGEPFDIVKGPDDDLWFTDNNRSRISRLVDGAPRTTTGTATAIGTSTAAVGAVADPRGNETTVVFDYGPSTAYGQTSAPVTVPAGIGPLPVTTALAGLAAGTTYHVRARAINGEGGTAGADATFTTALLPAPAPPGPIVARPVPRIARVTARTTFHVRTSARTHRTVVTSVVISGLKGTERATLTCTGRRCPFRTAKRFTLTRKSLRKGARSFGRSVFGNRDLSGTTTISVQVTAPGAIGTSTVLQIRPHKRFRIVRRCVQPGARKTSVCPA